MANRVCTNFIDDDGLDVGCHLVSKEYVLEAYPELVPWMKTPALWAWGFGSTGELGTNDAINRSSPVQTITGGTNWRELTTRGGIKTDGTLWVWGGNYFGSLGINDTIARSSPIQTISGGTNWKSMEVITSTGDSRLTVSTKTDGTLWLWGCNAQGQLGDNTIISRSSPVQTISNVTTWKSVTTSGAHSSAIKTDGTLWTWGCNTFGELGDNTATFRSSPVQTISGGTNWKSISASSNFNAAIKTDGSLWLWGNGINGQLGTNNAISRSSPVQTVSAVTNWKQASAGGSQIAAIKTDGTLWAWGQNFNGILGTYSPFTNRSSPVQAFSGATNWRSVSFAGTLYTIAGGLKTDGTLWMWGCGVGGKLGNNSTVNRSSPVQTISGGTNWRSMKVDGGKVLAIRDEGEF